MTIQNLVEKIECINCGEIFESDNEDDMVLQLCFDCQDTSDDLIGADCEDEVPDYFEPEVPRGD